MPSALLKSAFFIFLSRYEEKVSQNKYDAYDGSIVYNAVSISACLPSLDS